MRIRLPLVGVASRCKNRDRLAYKLAGKTLQLDRDKVYLHIPELELILPSHSLEARIVQSNQPELLRCLVISFGNVKWSKQQHTRVAVETIAIDTQNLERYQIFDRLLHS